LCLTSDVDRYSGTSLERRRKNGITSTNDFKALLLQNTTSRSPSSHHMTAAEKLRLTSPTVNKTRSPNNEEMMTTNRRGYFIKFQIKSSILVADKN